jgi:hypothetical protein
LKRHLPAATLPPLGWRVYSVKFAITFSGSPPRMKVWEGETPGEPLVAPILSHHGR